MLQRIQTVFIFIIITLMVLFLVFPVWVSESGSEGTIYRLYAFFLFYGPAGDPESGNWIFWPYILMGILAVLSVLVALMEVFSYKNRLTQIKLGALNSLLLGGVLVVTIYLVNQNQEAWMMENPGNYSIGIFFTPISIICNLFANRFIRKDEKLVRSMDRIR